MVRSMMETQSEYNVDRESFTRERPLGVSGILRCHNCADFLEICIESCIDGLDELIAVYHDCTDETPEILYQMQKKYWLKMQVYEYKPYLFPWTMDDGGFEFIKRLPSDSIHMFSNYSNFALSKVTYRYAVKIDSDQVLFPGLWKRICDAYRSTEKLQLNMMECISYNLFQAYKNCFHRKDMRCFRWLEKVAIYLYPSYFSYVEKMVVNHKIMVSLSGINLFMISHQWMIGLGTKDDIEMFPPFNGVGDLFFFEMSSNMSFSKWIPGSTVPGLHRIAEAMYHQKEVTNLGFFWFHLKPIMQEQAVKSEALYQKHPGRFLPLTIFKKMSYRELQRKYKPFIAAHTMEATFSYFYTACRKRIPWKNLNELLLHYQSVKEKNDMEVENTCDYYIEFYEELDKRLETFTLSLNLADKHLLQLGKYRIETPLITYLYCQLTGEKEYFNQCRLRGDSIDDAMRRIDGFLNILGECSDSPEYSENMEISSHSWYDDLLEYRHQLVIFLFNWRQLEYLTPLIRKLEQPVLLLSEFELPDTMDFSDNITTLTIELFKEKLYTHTFIEQKFPWLFRYANTFDSLLQMLQPKGVLCLEGCHIQEILLATIAQAYEIPSFCIQQGWPSMMRTGFRRFPYRYYFTWGEYFSTLWEECNPLPTYCQMGYMYEVEESEKYEKEYVTFFLQAPFLISSQKYFLDLMKLVTGSAQYFPHIKFGVREHPEYKLPASILTEWRKFANITVVSDWDLKEVYGRTLIVVSHCSSSLMEGVVHGSIPLVYDPTTGSRYNPDIEMEGIGKISTTPEEFLKSLGYILENKFKFQHQIACQRNEWFTAIGENTLNNMRDFLLNYCIPYTIE